LCFGAVAFGSNCVNNLTFFGLRIKLAKFAEAFDIACGETKDTDLM